MDQENKDGLEQEESNEPQVPRDIAETTISEIIEDMYFTNIKTFSPIPLEEMMTKYKDDVFWYVYDKTTATILAHRVKKKIEPVTYLFHEQADAQVWGWIGTKSGSHSLHELILKAAKFSDIVKSVEDTLGEFEVLAISHDEAQKVFENYPELKLTREVEERRKANQDSEESDYR
jgi:hypothetical protein